MGAVTLLPLAEYLDTSYSPDREYREGALVERNVGEKAHALLQIAIGAYVRRRRKQWKVEHAEHVRPCTPLKGRGRIWLNVDTT